MNLKELSQHLNLSPTTVSRALNGYPEVSEKTRERVQSAARALNYSPNARARSLATGRAQAVGHVIPLSTRHEMVNPIFGDFFAGAAYTYGDAGYEIMLSFVEDPSDPKVYRDIHARGSVDGLIVSAPGVEDARIALLSDLGLPFVVHGRCSTTTQPYSWVDTDNTSAFRRATDFLLDLGHRRIALINGLEEMDFAWRRRKGFEAALEARGIAPDPAVMRTDEMTERYGYVSAREMLARPARPTAFLVASLISAIGVRRAIQEAGLEMGRDVSVVTHDDDLASLKNGDDVPIFTATRSSVRRSGERVAEILLTLIHNPDHPPITHLMEAELIIGRSTGPAPT